MGLVIEFTVPGKPTGKGRPKFARRGNFVHTYTPQATASYEELVRWHYTKAASAMGIELIDGNVAMHVDAYYQIPASWSKKKREGMNGLPAPIKPDIDNVFKIVSDALNGVAWTDDAKVVNITAGKRYTLDNPRVVVRLVSLDD